MACDRDLNLRHGRKASPLGTGVSYMNCTGSQEHRRIASATGPEHLIQLSKSRPGGPFGSLGFGRPVMREPQDSEGQLRLLRANSVSDYRRRVIRGLRKNSWSEGQKSFRSY